MKRLLLLAALAIAGHGTADAQKMTKEKASREGQMVLEQNLEKVKDGLKKEWDAKCLTNGEFEMPFWIQLFGDKPADGRSMYISLHGGGGAPKELNDQQWENQKHLYTPSEGLYFVPRSPTNSWNMWHQGYMDEFLRKAIAAGVMFYGVNPNKVYIMGYSAGGDGLYQMAPRMSDAWAAASMMAGHPGDAQPEALRNVPFAIFMGGKDAAYDRNKLAQEWIDKLDQLQLVDPEGYFHTGEIYGDLGHWMMRRDTVALPWMADFSRNLNPKKVIWIQDDVLRDNFYWLSAANEEKKQGYKVVASIKDQTVEIETTDLKHVRVGLNDELLELDKPVTFVFNGKQVATKRLKRNKAALNTALQPSPYNVDAPYPVVVDVDEKGIKAIR